MTGSPEQDDKDELIFEKSTLLSCYTVCKKVKTCFCKSQIDCEQRKDSWFSHAGLCANADLLVCIAGSIKSLLFYRCLTNYKSFPTKISGGNNDNQGTVRMDIARKKRKENESVFPMLIIKNRIRLGKIWHTRMF